MSIERWGGKPTVSAGAIAAFGALSKAPVSIQPCVCGNVRELAPIPPRDCKSLCGERVLLQRQAKAPPDIDQRFGERVDQAVVVIRARRDA